jgi:hypothetical protein
VAKTAKELGISLPAPILLRADEVIDKFRDFRYWHVAAVTVSLSSSPLLRVNLPRRLFGRLLVSD